MMAMLRISERRTGAPAALEGSPVSGVIEGVEAGMAAGIGFIRVSGSGMEG